MSYNPIRNEQVRRRRAIIKRRIYIYVYGTAAILSIGGIIVLIYGGSILPQITATYAQGTEDTNALYAKQTDAQIHSVGFIYMMVGASCIITGFLILLTAGLIGLSDDNRIVPLELMERGSVVPARAEVAAPATRPVVVEPLPIPPIVPEQTVVSIDLQPNEASNNIALRDRPPTPHPIIYPADSSELRPPYPYSVYGWYKYPAYPRWGPVQII
jgi:hypothetical protein